MITWMHEHPIFIMPVNSCTFDSETYTQPYQSSGPFQSTHSIRRNYCMNKIEGLRNGLQYNNNPMLVYKASQSRNCRTEQYSSNPSALISCLPISNSSARDLFPSPGFELLGCRSPRFAPAAPTLAARFCSASTMSS